MVASTDKTPTGQPTIASLQIEGAKTWKNALLSACYKCAAVLPCLMQGAKRGSRKNPHHFTWAKPHGRGAQCNLRRCDPATMQLDPEAQTSTAASEGPASQGGRNPGCPQTAACLHPCCRPQIPHRGPGRARAGKLVLRGFAKLKYINTD